MTPIEILAWSVVLGVGGAAAMDLWALLARSAFGIRGLDYALLGRWLGHLPKGRVAHERIGAADPVPGERPLGWLAHYAIGVTFAAVLLAGWGAAWLRAPSVVPPLVVGLVTVLAPWLVMQPAMGSGIAGSRTPDPRATRLRNVATHAVYGLGLYATALVATRVVTP
jgi:hypothetical protein